MKLIILAVFCALVVLVAADGYGQGHHGYGHDGYGHGHHGYGHGGYGHGHHGYGGHAEVHVKRHPYGFSYHVHESGHGGY